MRAALREAVIQLTATRNWVESKPYHELRVNHDMASDLERNRTLYGYGIVAIIHVYHLKVAPHPISPFLLAVCMCKSTSVLALFTLQDIERLDPDKAELLRPWFQVIKGPESLYVPEKLSEPLAMLLNGHGITVRSSEQIGTMLTCGNS